MKQLPALFCGAALTLAMASPAIAGPNSLFGEKAPSSAAQRTIYINHDTQYVNVTGGDVVKFVVHNKTYTWDFDTASNINEVSLNRLLPKADLHHVVRIYVARDPTYLGA